MVRNPYAVDYQATDGEQSLMAQLAGVQRSSQIVAAGLITAVVMMTVVVMVMIRGDVGGLQNGGLLTMIAGAFGGLMMVNQIVIPQVIVGSQLRRLAGEQLTAEQRIERLGGLFLTQLTIGLALLEGAAIFNLIVLMLEKCVVSFAAAAVLLGLMLVRFPTKTKTVWWVQEKLAGADIS